VRFGSGATVSFASRRLRPSARSLCPRAPKRQRRYPKAGNRARGRFDAGSTGCVASSALPYRTEDEAGVRAHLHAHSAIPRAEETASGGPRDSRPSRNRAGVRARGADATSGGNGCVAASGAGPGSRGRSARSGLEHLDQPRQRAAPPNWLSERAVGGAALLPSNLPPKRLSDDGCATA